MPLERPTHDMITILKSSDPVELATGESALRDSGIPFFTKNQGVQHFIGIGQIGGRNLVTGQPEIQVTEDDFDRAKEILAAVLERPEVSFEDPELEADDDASMPDVALQNLAIRHARYSAAWAVLGMIFDPTGIFSLIAIWFGVQAVRRWSALPTSQKWLAITGLVIAPVTLLTGAVELLSGVPS